MTPSTHQASFLQRIAHVFLGTLGAQAITFGVTLLLTRLYTPAEMGTFNVWLAFLTVGAAAATARYEQSFFAAGSVAEAPAIGKLIVLVALTLSAGTYAVLKLMSTATSVLPSSVEPYLLALACAIFGTALNNALLSVLAFERRFFVLGASRVGIAASVAAMQVIGGLLGIGAAGLIYGQLLGCLAAAALIVACLDRRWLAAVRATPIHEVRDAALRYRSFPLFALPADLTNNVARQLPLLIVVSRFGAELGGWYGLTLKMMGAPIALLATSILDVFKEQAARDYREHGNCVEVYRKTLRTLALLALPPFTLMYFISEPLFALLFGEQWRQSGVFARLMLPMFYVGFVASPLSYILYITQKQKYDLVWQACLLAVSVAAFGFAADAEAAITWYSLGCTAMYLVYLCMSYHFAKGKP